MCIIVHVKFLPPRIIENGLEGIFNERPRTHIFDVNEHIQMHTNMYI